MNLASLEEKLNDYGSGGYYLLESFILQLLKVEADSFEQPFELEEKQSHFRGDAFAPRGLGAIAGPLAIEIIQVLTPRRLEAELHRHSSHRRSEDEKLLIISFRELGRNSGTVQKLKDDFSGQIYLWGAQEIQKLLDKHEAVAEDLSKKIFSIRFKRAISNSSEDWQKNVRRSWPR